MGWGRWDQLRSRIACARLRRHGAVIGSGCRIATSAQLGPGPFTYERTGLKIGDRCHVDVGALVYTYGGTIAIGDHVYVGPYTVIYGHGGVVIGSDTLIAMGCSIVSSNHAIPCQRTRIRSLPDVKSQTTIGQDCWLGAGVKVMSGVTIEDGCIIGAGTVVTRDIPSYSIAVGTPARIVRSRLPK